MSEVLVVSRILLLTKLGGVNRPSQPAKLVGAESFDSTNAYLQLGKGGLPPADSRRGQRWDSSVSHAVPFILSKAKGALEAAQRSTSRRWRNCLVEAPGLQVEGRWHQA
jgi:hypothetical protein